MPEPGPDVADLDVPPTGDTSRILTVPNVMSLVRLACIPLFLYLLGINRAYVELLWTTPIGMGMSAAGLISLAVGVFWMSKVVKVEV